MKKLYSNIGDKVCKVAEICGRIGAVCAAIGLVVSVICISGGEYETLIFGVIAAVLGIVSVISSWPLYAFGQITNDVHAMRTSASQKTNATQFSDLPEL